MSGCNRRHLMELRYYADVDHCETKSLSKFQAMEDRFVSLDDCCRAKFPQNISDCCEAGGNGCNLSGNLKFIPVSISPWSKSFQTSVNALLTASIFLSRIGRIKFVSPRMRYCWQSGSKLSPRQL